LVILVLFCKIFVCYTEIGSWSAEFMLTISTTSDIVEVEVASKGNCSDYDQSLVSSPRFVER
jgi:hypothetical protein